MRDNPDYTRYDIGGYTYGAPLILDNGDPGGSLKIGRYCSIAPGVTILLGSEHFTDRITTYPFKPKGTPNSRTKGAVVIGNDVWIGRDATILSGVTIGNGSVVGACAVVAKDVEAYSIVVGNPAKKIRSRFNQDQITKLEALKWYDWTPPKVYANLPLLLNGDVDALIKANP